MNEFGLIDKKELAPLHELNEGIVSLTRLNYHRSLRTYTRLPDRSSSTEHQPQRIACLSRACVTRPSVSLDAVTVFGRHRPARRCTHRHPALSLLLSPCPATNVAFASVVCLRITLLYLPVCCSAFRLSVLYRLSAPSVRSPLGAASRSFRMQYVCPLHAMLPLSPVGGEFELTCGCDQSWAT